MQIQANFSKKKIIRPQVIETTAYGVALGSVVGLGEIPLSKVDELWKEDCQFDPINDDYYQMKSKSWSSLIKRLFTT